MQIEQKLIQHSYYGYRSRSTCRDARVIQGKLCMLSRHMIQSACGIWLSLCHCKSHVAQALRANVAP